MGKSGLPSARTTWSSRKVTLLPWASARPGQARSSDRVHRERMGPTFPERGFLARERRPQAQLFHSTFVASPQSYGGALRLPRLPRPVRWGKGRPHGRPPWSAGTAVLSPSPTRARRPPPRPGGGPDTGGGMTDDTALLGAVLEAPGDEAPRLVYADWLEERGDP